MAARSTGAIATRPTGNAQGAYYFFSLSTGRMLKRDRWMALPMPNKVINRVHCTACQGHANHGLIFTDRADNEIADDPFPEYGNKEEGNESD